MTTYVSVREEQIEFLEDALTVALQAKYAESSPIATRDLSRDPQTFLPEELPRLLILEGYRKKVDPECFMYQLALTLVLIVRTSEVFEDQLHTGYELERWMDTFLPTLNRSGITVVQVEGQSTNIQYGEREVILSYEATLIYVEGRY